jgi:threonine/homoserine/homoserine lactone efflux protein
MYLVPRLLVNVRERLVRFHQFQTTIDYIFGVTAIALAVYIVYRLSGK